MNISGILGDFNGVKRLPNGSVFQINGNDRTALYNKFELACKYQEKYRQGILTWIEMLLDLYGVDKA